MITFFFKIVYYTFSCFDVRKQNKLNSVNLLLINSLFFPLKSYGVSSCRGVRCLRLAVRRLRIDFFKILFYFISIIFFYTFKYDKLHTYLLISSYSPFPCLTSLCFQAGSFKVGNLQSYSLLWIVPFLKILFFEGYF